MNFIIIGCGRVGAGLVHPLIQQGHTVVLVDQDPAVCVSLGAGGPQRLIVDRTVNGVTIIGEVRVVAISRRGCTFLPTLGRTFSVGDLVHLTVLTTAANRVEALFADI